MDTEDVMAVAYDTPVPGYDPITVNTMRLWSAHASRDFNVKYFDESNSINVIEQKSESEMLFKVLYPDDTTKMGREYPSLRVLYMTGPPGGRSSAIVGSDRTPFVQKPFSLQTLADTVRDVLAAGRVSS